MNAIMVKSQSIQGLKKNSKRMVMINHNIDDEFVRKFKWHVYILLVVAIYTYYFRFAKLTQTNYWVDHRLKITYVLHEMIRSLSGLCPPAGIPGSRSASPGRTSPRWWSRIHFLHRDGIRYSQSNCISLSGDFLFLADDSVSETKCNFEGLSPGNINEKSSTKSLHLV